MKPYEKLMDQVEDEIQTWYNDYREFNDTSGIEEIFKNIHILIDLIREGDKPMSKYITAEEALKRSEKNKGARFKALLDVINHEINLACDNGERSVRLDFLAGKGPQILSFADIQPLRQQKVLEEFFPGFHFEWIFGDQREEARLLSIIW